MSDIYDDEDLDAVQTNEIGPSGRSLMAPDAVALGGPTHHQGADYGEPDTTVTVLDGLQVVHGGVVYEGGETVDVPSAVAAYWVRSGWATADFDANDEAASEPTPPTKAPSKGKVSASGSGRRSPMRQR